MTFTDGALNLLVNVAIWIGAIFLVLVIFDMAADMFDTGIDE